MKTLNIVVNLAVSLFLAPTPGLLILLYANGGTEIPPLPGLAVMALSATGYWLWLINRRNRLDDERAVAHVRELAADPMSEIYVDHGVATGGAPGLPANTTGPATAGAERRRAEAALRGHMDIPDPISEQSGQAPHKVLLDRIADLRQLKVLVMANEVSLVNHFYRTVHRDDFGSPQYGDWAYEADRFLMSSAFTARTLNRHEAIAAVTAEVEFLAQGARAQARTAALAPAPRIALPAPAPEPADLVRAYPHHAVEPAQPVDRHQSLSEALMRRAAARRSHGFAQTCAEVLQAQGWQTQATDASGADGIDLFAERGDVIVGLRARFSEDPVSEDAVNQVLAARERFGLDAAGVISSSGFSKPARALATVNGICLLDEEDLPDLHLFVGHRKKVVPLFRAAAKA